MQAPIEIERLSADRGGVIACLALNRPEALNSISVAMQDALEAALHDLAADREVRVLLISGRGRAFCTGADLKERAGMSAAEVDQFLARSLTIFQHIEDFPRPTIALIHGFALGGGLEMALCCDLRIVAADAELGLPETALAIIPGAGGTQRLPRLIGMARAAELIFSAGRISGEEAARIGLANRALPLGELQTKGLALAQSIAANAPIAVAQAKAAMRGGAALPLADGLAWERRCYEATLQSADRQEALNAFREKRRPVFKGE